MPLRTLIAGLALIAAFAAHAQQYRWLDQKGRVQYTDTPPPPYAKGVEKKILRSGAAPDGQEPFALQIARKNSPVKLYSTPDCGPGCDDARKLLVQRGIPFTEISVTQGVQMEELKRASDGSVVPVMLVGSSVQKGFEAESYHRALDAAGYPRTKASAGDVASPPLSAPAAKDGKGAAKAPVDPAQAFNERQLKEKEEAAKAEKERVDRETRQKNCDRTQGYLRALEQGQRISTTNAQGERALLDDTQRQAELEETKAEIAKNCK